MICQNLSKKLILIGPIDRNNRRIAGLSTGFNAFRRYLDKRVIPHHVIDTRPFNGVFGLIASLINLVSRVFIQVPRCDVVFVHASYNGILYLYPLLFLFCRVFRQRFCFYPVGGDFLDVYDSRPSWHRALIRHTLFRSDVLFLETLHLMDRFKGLGANAVWCPSGCARPQGVSKLQMYSRRFVFLSRVCREKGIEIVRQVLHKLDERFTIDVYGPIDGYDEEARGWVNYKGAVLPVDVLDVLGRYNVLVLPTFFSCEGYPRVIIEAYSLGMPVIATNWMAIPEIVEHGVSGILIEPGSAVALADAMQSIDEDVYEQLCVGARNMFKKFDSDVTNPRILDALFR